MKRTEDLHLRLTLEDKATIEELAREDGVPVSEEVRRLAGRERKRRKSRRDAERLGVKAECLGCSLLGRE